jgi:antirestriction protein ArdC
MNQAEIKDMVTGLIMAELESGNAPWRKGWATAGYVPTSLQTGKPYQGINTLLLSIAGMDYTRPLWITFNQAKKLGGSVKKGEKATKVVFMSRIDKKVPEGDPAKSFFMYKLDSVFNIDQTEGVELPSKYLDTREPVTPLEGINAIWEGYANRPTLYYREQAGAFYSPSADSITLPALKQFDSASEHAYTFAHEMIHSTGHESRVNRWKDSADKPSAFGCESYAKEELVAELGSCMLLSTAGIEFDLPNSGAYVKNWLTALKNDTSLIFKASAKAQQAVACITGAEVKEEVSA